MFKRDKETRPPKQNSDIAQAVTLQQAYSKEFDGMFADIERTSDTADKVLKLQQLVSHIDNADTHIAGWRKYIADNHARKKGEQAAGTGAVAGATAAAIPIVILAPPLAGLIFTAAGVGLVTGKISTEGRIKKKSQELVAQNADLNDFQILIATKRAQAAKMLDETVKGCDLEKLPLCENFGAALNSCAPLRERFAKAAAEAARQALEEKAAPEEQAPTRKKLRIFRPPNP